MDNSFILISIFQLNVAIGILYTALPKFRFSENLYNNVVDCINSYGFFANQDVAHNLAGSNDNYGVPYRYIRGLVNTLPTDFHEKLEGIEKFDSYTSSSPPERLWHLWHAWYAKNVDKWLVWIVSIIAPFLALWLCFFSVEFLDYCNIVYFSTLIVFAGLGQVIPIMNVLWGFWMVRKVSKKVNASLAKAMPIYWGADIEASIKKMPGDD